MLSDSDAQRVREWLCEADGLLITAGAGMGVDSGLPDFRGREGFWNAYPPLRHLGLDFVEIANPDHFHSRPALAWGFYGHRLALYRRTVPHEGFHILQRMAARYAQGAFVFTSNVDGQFQKAGFAENRVCECHGSIHHLQCLDDCHDAIWTAQAFNPDVDAARCELTNDAPRCPRCNALARPNILMFGDYGWQGARTEAQERELERWLLATPKALVIELGAGTAVPSVRHFSRRTGWRVIRVNPTEPETLADKGVGIRAGALEALRWLEAL